MTKHSHKPVCASGELSQTRIASPQSAVLSHLHLRLDLHASLMRSLLTKPRSSREIPGHWGPQMLEIWNTAGFVASAIIVCSSSRMIFNEQWWGWTPYLIWQIKTQSKVMSNIPNSCFWTNNVRLILIGVKLKLVSTFINVHRIGFCRFYEGKLTILRPSTKNTIRHYVLLMWMSWLSNTLKSLNKKTANRPTLFFLIHFTK